MRKGKERKAKKGNKGTKTIRRGGEMEKGENVCRRKMGDAVAYIFLFFF